MDGTQDQTETHDQLEIPAGRVPAEITTEVKKEVKKERIKNPKRVEQGKKLAEWNKANKKRLSQLKVETLPLQLETLPLQLETPQLEDKTSQLEVEDEASQPQLTTFCTKKLTTKKLTTKKDYFLIAETILIISLVGAGLFFYATTTLNKEATTQLKAGTGKAKLEHVEAATKKATDANIATNKSNEDDCFEM